MEVSGREIGVVTDPPALKTVKDLSEFFWAYFKKQQRINTQP